MLKHSLFNRENDDKAWMLGVPYIQANPCGAACSSSWQCLKLEMHRFRPSTRDMNSELQLRLIVDKLVQHNIPKSKRFLSCAVVVAAVVVGRVLFSQILGGSWSVPFVRMAAPGPGPSGTCSFWIAGSLGWMWKPQNHVVKCGKLMVVLHKPISLWHDLSWMYSQKCCNYGLETNFGA